MKSFTLSDAVERDMNEWVLAHNRTCRRAQRKGPSPVGVGTTVSFTQTSIGVMQKISCPCGAKEDLTDYSTF